MPELRLPQGAALPPSEATYDEVLSSVTDIVPGFGGAYVEGDASIGQPETLHVWLIDPSRIRADLARDALALRLGPRFAQDRVVIRTADFSFRDLKQWHDATVDVLSLPGAAYTDIDERRNRFVIGVEDLTVHGDAVRDLLTERGVPLDAVEIEQGSPFRPLDTDGPGLLQGPTLIGALLLSGVALGFVSWRRTRTSARRG